MVARGQKDDQHPVEKSPFGPKNYVAFALGLLTIGLGYVFLSKGSITAAPILLVLGYCVIIPVAIMLK